MAEQIAEARVAAADPQPGRKAALRLLLRRIEFTLAETGKAFPLYAERQDAGTVRWVTTVDGNWCAGYWIGLLWLAAKHSPTEAERNRFLDAAYDHVPAMLAQPTEHLFAGLNHHYAGFLGYDIVEAEELKRIGLRGADAMLALYNPAAQQIPIGTYVTAPAHTTRNARTPVRRDDFAAVDAIHTSLPVLWRAFAETGDRRYRDVATAHLARHLEWHVRPDGSTTQLTTFDTESGARQETFNTLAGDEGCWSRGFGWHIAGLANAFVATGEPTLLAAIEGSMNYYRAHTGPALLPAWDLDCRDPDANLDASAAAIVAYGLILLGRRSGSRTLALEATGAAILDSLIADCLVSDETASNAGAILHGCYRFPRQIAVDNELIWTDFYVAASLDMLADPWWNAATH